MTTKRTYTNKVDLNRDDFDSYEEYRKEYKRLWAKTDEGEQSLKTAKQIYRGTTKGQKQIKHYSDRYYQFNDEEIKMKTNAYHKTPKGQEVLKKGNKKKRDEIRLLRENGVAEGFLIYSYNRMKTKCKEQNIPCSFVDTKTSTGWEKFLKYFYDYVETYGCVDYYTGEPMTFIHWDIKTELRPMTNISVDRIQPHSSGIGYVTAKGRRKTNVAFCTYGTNAIKNAVTYQIAKRQIEAVEKGIPFKKKK
jgi:hypothetical protein